jgi:hypothetical protein
MLYQMLTGEVPRGAAPPPSEMTPEIDPRLDAIVAKAMADLPCDRYADASSLLQALEDLRRTQASEGLPETTFFNAAPPTPAPPAPVVQHAPPPAAYPAQRAYDDASSSYPESQGSSSLLPWLASLVVVAIAGFWAWQQWREMNGLAQPATSTAPPLVVMQPTKPESTPPASPAPSDMVAASPAPAENSPGTDPSGLSASPPAPASPTPAAAPPPPTIPPEELAETQRRITQIQADFDASAKEWQAGQDAKFDQLEAFYLRAVRNEIVAMRNERRLEDLAGLQEEERLLVSNTPLPPLDVAAPFALVRLRSIYDAEVLKTARTGVETKIELYNRLLGSLFAYQSILNQTSK